MTKKAVFFNEKWQINISFRFLFVSFSRSFTVSVCVSCLIIYMLRYAGQYVVCMGRDGAKSVDISKNRAILFFFFFFLINSAFKLLNLIKREQTTIEYFVNVRLI